MSGTRAAQSVLGADGPVTFTVPVRQTGAHQADVTVSYGACSETTCLMPVNDEVIHLSLH